MHISNSIQCALTRLKKFFYTIAVFVLLSTLFLSTGCKKELDYTVYISELRSNVFLANTEEFTLRVYAVHKETPYVPDGIPRERTHRVEARFTAPSGDKTCRFYFTHDGQESGGEMHYDNVKAEYYYSCSLDISALSTLPCRIEYGEKTLTLNVPSVKRKDTLSATQIIKKLQVEESELFASMTDKYGFTGEIYVRLIYEESPYYYVGIINRNGGVHAFLLNAQSGKILAKRTT